MINECLAEEVRKDFHYDQEKIEEEEDEDE